MIIERVRGRLWYPPWAGGSRAHGGYGGSQADVDMLPRPLQPNFTPAVIEALAEAVTVPIHGRLVVVVVGLFINN